MITSKILLSLLLLFLLSCGHTRQPKDGNLSISVKTDKISEKEVYEFIKVVINEQDLHKDYGLSLLPEPSLDLTENDTAFLTAFLKDTLNIENKNLPKPASPPFGRPEKCLTQSDIDFMLAQRSSLSNFKWDNSILGFNLKNKENWYSFSVPLFSKDKMKSIIMIETLCSNFLCGTGSILLFEKQNNNSWVAKKAGGWIH